MFSLLSFVGIPVRAAEGTVSETWLWQKLVEAQKHENTAPKRAEEVYLEAAEAAPESVEVWRRWGSFLARRKKYAEAAAALEKAHGLHDNDAAIARQLGFTLMKANKPEAAIPYLEQAAEGFPDDFFVFSQLGSACQETGRQKQAIDAWEEALALAEPNSQNERAIRQRINQARENLHPADGPGKIIENDRFVIHFAGDSHVDLQGLTEEVLDEVFRQITQDLGYRPLAKTEVLFFKTDEFHTANQAKTWVGGLASGNRILVPLKGGYQDLAAVKGLFAHELTHVIIIAQTGGHCPIWIHEGLAEFQELQARQGDPLQMRPNQRKLFEEVMIRRNRFPDLDTISFTKEDDDSEEISLAYLASYLGIRYLIEHFGRESVPKLLNSLATGAGTSAALQQATGIDLPTFQAAVTHWIQGL